MFYRKFSMIRILNIIWKFSCAHVQRVMIEAYFDLPTGFFLT